MRGDQTSTAHAAARTVSSWQSLRFAVLMTGAMIVLWLVLSAAAFAQSFVPGSEDVPMAPGLTAQGAEPVVFDSPAGRIVEAFATGTTDRASITSFYTGTLPALGWQAEEAGLAFQRDGERLTLDFFGADGALTVRFTLAPE